MKRIPEIFFNNYLQKLSEINYESLDLSKYNDIISKLCGYVEKKEYCDNNYLIYADNDREIKLMPGNYDHSQFLKQFESEYYGSTQHTGNCHKSLLLFFEHIRKEYDLILIDLSPDLSLFSRSILRLSDHVINVLNPDCFAEVTLKLSYFKFEDKSNNLNYASLPVMPNYIGFIFNRCIKRTVRGQINLITTHDSILTKLNTLSKEHFNHDRLGVISDLSGNLLSIMHNGKLFFSELEDSNNKAKIRLLSSEMKHIITNIFDRIIQHNKTKDVVSKKGKKHTLSRDQQTAIIDEKQRTYKANNDILNKQKEIKIKENNLITKPIR
jgi:cellulose biosynthesis protein BcsQ